MKSIVGHLMLLVGGENDAAGRHRSRQMPHPQGLLDRMRRQPAEQSAQTRYSGNTASGEARSERRSFQQTSAGHLSPKQIIPLDDDDFNDF